MPDHRILVSSETHEPKHITNSTGADAGKVITPLGGGASELRSLTPAEVGIRIAYGEAGSDANTTSFSSAAAADATLYSTADYLALNSIRVPGSAADELFNVTYDGINNTLTPAISGVYSISFWMNVTTNIADNLTGVKAKVNGGWADFTIKNQVKDANRAQNISGFVIKQLTAGEPVALYFATEKAGTVVVQGFRLDLSLMREV